MGRVAEHGERAHMRVRRGGARRRSRRAERRVGFRRTVTLADGEGPAGSVSPRRGRGEIGVASSTVRRRSYERESGTATEQQHWSTISYRRHRRWRKLISRPFHPKRDLAAQDAFAKKAACARGVRRAARAAAARGRPCRVTVRRRQARFSQINRPRPFWAHGSSSRPAVACATRCASTSTVRLRPVPKRWGVRHDLDRLRTSERHDMLPACARRSPVTSAVFSRPSASRCRPTSVRPRRLHPSIDGGRLRLRKTWC